MDIDDDLLWQMRLRDNSARDKRPDIPEDERLFSLLGEESVTSVADVNASNEPMVFGCIRITDTVPEFVVPGSEHIPCSECREVCWISPASREMAKKIINHRVLCLQCTGVMMEAKAKEAEESEKKTEEAKLPDAP